MYLILDTETTGVTPTDRVVSISWALYDESATRLLLTHHIISPDGFSIPREASAIHGISTEDARRKGISIKEALDGLSRDLARHRPVLFVGHNVNFDRPIVLNEYARLGIESALSKLPTYCTMRSTVEFCRIPRYNGGYKWPTLQELHRKLFGLPPASAHDAQGDVVACAKCFFELRQRGLVVLKKATTGPRGPG
jgi:DNA polymerase III epsilon subunit-like protein